MNPDLKALIQLQEIDHRILDLDRQTQNVPIQIQSIQQAIDGGQARVAGLREAVSEKQRGRRKAELDVEALRAKLAKYRDQLMTVKTNKEYTAMLKEIELCDQEIRKSEDSILEMMVSLDSLDSELSQATGEIQASEAKLLAQRTELESLLATYQSARDAIVEERTAVENAIPGGLLERYRRIAGVRKGVALAEARDECCMGCRVRLRPQVFNDLRRNELILTCDSCGRILYFVPPPPQAPVIPPTPQLEPGTDSAPAVS